MTASVRLMNTHALARLVGFGMLAGLSVLAGCAKSEPMTPASLETQAEGRVSTTRDGNDDVVVRVAVAHLAPPSSLGATTYVVWLDAPGVLIQNVGPLKLDDELEGSLEFATRLRVFRVVVTPEAQATSATPSRRAVFTADVNER